MSKPILIESNFGVEAKKNSHPVVIFDNHIYWWKNTNKDTSQKFNCGLRNIYKCTATIKLMGEDVIGVTGFHFHHQLSDAEIQSKIELQNMKKEVVNHPLKSIKQCYNTAHSNLLKDFEERTVDANFPTFKKVSSCLQKRKSKKRSNQPDELVDIVANNNQPNENQLSIYPLVNTGTPIIDMKQTNDKKPREQLVDFQNVTTCEIEKVDQKVWIKKELLLKCEIKTEPEIFDQNTIKRVKLEKEEKIYFDESESL